MKLLLSEHQKTFRKLAIAYIKKVDRNIKILVIAGPSWAGKTTLIRTLLKKFPSKFTVVVQVSTRPPHKNVMARRYVSLNQFWKENIVLKWMSGLYPCWYTVEDLLMAMKKNKIIIFESIARFEMLQKILKRVQITWMIVGILPPGENIQKMLQELEKRLRRRTDFSLEDMEKKIADATSRIIPGILSKADLIITSANYKTESDIGKIMKMWITKTWK